MQHVFEDRGVRNFMIFMQSIHVQLIHAHAIHSRLQFIHNCHDLVYSVPVDRVPRSERLGVDHKMHHPEFVHNLCSIARRWVAQPLLNRGSS